LVVGPVACGGDDEQDVQELLDRAFDRPLNSMDLKVEAEIDLQGLEGVDRPIRIEASGPYVSGGEELPSFDLDLDIGGGPGQTVSTGRVSTGDQAFVKFEDSYYEVDPAEVRRANREFAAGRDNPCRRNGIGIDPRPWVENAEVKGDERVAGVETTHVAGRLDVDRMLRDLNQFVSRCSSLLGTAAGGAPDPLSQSDLDKIAQVVNDPTFDIYVGKDDDIIRRLSASIEVEVPEADRETVGGLEGGSLRFSVEFADVNGDQQVEAPARSRPLSELTSQLGAGALSGGIGDLGGGEAEDPEEPPPADTSPPPATPGGSGQAAPEVEDFQRYADCLDQVEPDDTEALQRCSALLAPQP
jgi:hypothetical protein